MNHAKSEKSEPEDGGVAGVSVRGSCGCKTCGNEEMGGFRGKVNWAVGKGGGG